MADIPSHALDHAQVEASLKQSMHPPATETDSHLLASEGNMLDELISLQPSPEANEEVPPETSLMTSPPGCAADTGGTSDLQDGEHDHNDGSSSGGYALPHSHSEEDPPEIQQCGSPGSNPSSGSKEHADSTSLPDQLEKAGIPPQPDQGAAQNENECLQAALLSMREGKYDDALYYLNISATSDDQSLKFKALLHRSMTYLFQADYSKAFSDAYACQHLDPNCHDGFRVLGLARLSSGDSHGASEAFHQALTLLPASAEEADRKEILDGIHVAQRDLLAAWPRVAGSYRTVAAYEYDLKYVWQRSSGLMQVLQQGCGGTCVQCPIRQFAMVHHTSAWQHMRWVSGQNIPGRLPYVLTVPEAHAAGYSGEHRFPLLVYLHSAGCTDMCKGDREQRAMDFVLQEAPHSILIDRGSRGVVDQFIGIAPCCPPNVQVLGQCRDK